MMTLSLCPVQLDDQDTKGSVSDERNHFHILNPNAFAIFATRVLDAKEIRNLGECCKHLHVLTQQRVIWSTLMYRDSGVMFNLSTDTEAKRAYHLVRRRVFDDLKCYHTLTSFKEICDSDDELLGFPIDFTINPKKNTIDHILAPMDGFLSYKAFHAMCHRKSATGIETRVWIPFYLTQTHFDRAVRRGIFQDSILKCSPGETRFRPELAILVLSKICNTMVLLLSDDGLKSCERVLQGYV